MKKGESKRYPIKKLCEVHNVSRQAYYKRRKQFPVVKYIEEIILEQVYMIRRRMPFIGGKKLYSLISPPIKSMGYSYGRDRFLRLYKNHNLLIIKRRRGVRTTDSYHRFRKYPNLIKQLRLSKPNEVWVSDITYIRLQKGFCYLFLITDAYSRMIVGYYLSTSLGIEGALKALEMALSKKPEGAEVIHHSDRGVQYCSLDYVGLLKEHDVKISMTEENHVYENALAERVNGILKQEFMLGETFKNYETVFKIVKESIKIYNEERPHMSLNYRTPLSCHVAG
jgi:transposase InsO family protein